MFLLILFVPRHENALKTATVHIVKRWAQSPYRPRKQLSFQANGSIFAFKLLDKAGSRNGA